MPIGKRKQRQIAYSTRKCYLIFSIAALATLVSFWYNIVTLHSSTQSPIQTALSRSKRTITRIQQKPEALLKQSRLTWRVAANGDNNLNILHDQVGSPSFLQLVHSLCASQQGNTKEDIVLQQNTTICVNGTLPPFQHALPHFVPGTNDEQIFLLQPENTKSMSPHWMDTSWETCFVFFPLQNETSSAILSARIVGVQSFWFQHFHDNALSFLYQARQGLDAIVDAVLENKNSKCHRHLQERIMYEHPARGSEILQEEWSMLGFPKSHLYQTTRLKEVSSRYGGVSVVRKRYPRDADQVRLHSTHAQWFQRNLPLPTRNNYPLEQEATKRVIWISRQGAQLKGPFARQCINEGAIITHLKQKTKHDDAEISVYNPSSNKLESVALLVDYFADVCAIVGIHGGGLYNQFFATHSAQRSPTTIIELFPVNDKGLIHGQMTNRSTPQIAHRSIWHNANALGQPYWRIHFVANNPKAFDIPLSAVDTVLRALELTDCVGSKGRD